MKPAFTPGPWGIWDGGETVIDGDVEYQVIDVASNETPAEYNSVAQLVWPVGDKSAETQTRADAHLASAAPDMYEALTPFAEEGVELTDSGCHRGMGLSPGQCARCSKAIAARAALAKARGER